MMSEFIVSQVCVGGFDQNFSYLIVHPDTGESAVVDPCGDVSLIREVCNKHEQIVPKYILITHGHGDHTSGICEIRSFFNAPVAAHPDSPVKSDISVHDRERLEFGNSFFECFYAPGHTGDSMLYKLGDDSAVFTGDTLFVDWCGYCEPERMFRTMREVVFPLPDSCEVYSGHNYGRVPHSSLGREKVCNPYLSAETFDIFKGALKNL